MSAVAQVSCGVALALLALALGIAPAKGRDNGDPWERLLGAVGLTRSTCRFDLLDMALYGSGEYRLAQFDALHQDPLRIPFYSRTMRASILNTRGAAGPLLSWACARTGDGTRLDLLGDPTKHEAEAAAKPDALPNAIRRVMAFAGKPTSRAEDQQLAARLRSVPADVQRAAALLLQAEVRAASWRNKALHNVDAALLRRAFRALTAPPPKDDEEPPELESLRRTVDMKRMMVGGELLAFALDASREILARHKGSERFRFDVDTPLGRISLHGVEDDTYAAGIGYLLILDIGGSDTYRTGGCTSDLACPVSLLVDVAGDDRYIERPQMDSSGVAGFPSRNSATCTPAFGVGILGYGMLLDMAGNDTYRAIGNTQGCGIFGVGLLADMAGDDRYDCHTLGQGAALSGTGVLIDGGGADLYQCFAMSQGYGGTKGAGLLADFGAQNDRYEANDTEIDFPSPQTAQHNANLAQGFGNGLRADYTDGHSLAGGVGVLMDEGGDNVFRCGLFGQGGGYWYGLGMLLAGTGSDTYDGVWYVQGAAAHFAVGVLADEGGDDLYRATMNMAQGAGHDFSVGFLIDRAGNDRYEAPNLSLGGGNANGMGFFWDRAGDDTYSVRPSTTLGRSSIEASGRNSVRERNLTLGLFLDTGGSDTYPADIKGPANNALWTMANASPPPLLSIRGAGLDVEALNVDDPP